VWIEWISTVGAACAFLLAAAYGMSTRRGLAFLLVGLVLCWTPALMRAFTEVMAIEKTRIAQHGSLRGERGTGAS
jgi:hypothetical protein